MNRLYAELLKVNPDWDNSERREDLNHFMARLIFCFFAEDTGIFGSDACKPLNLRNRLARILVFDPPCGSGNFLVIAYRQMRKIE